jgi:hypothetical protein
MLNIVMLSVIMLSVIMLSIFMLNVVMLSRSAAPKFVRSFKLVEEMAS